MKEVVIFLSGIISIMTMVLLVKADPDNFNTIYPFTYLNWIPLTLMVYGMVAVVIGRMALWFWVTVIILAIRKVFGFADDD